MKLRSELKDWFVAILCSSRKIQLGPPATALFMMEKKRACLVLIWKKSQSYFLLLL